jgi:hypothetical protein
MEYTDMAAWAAEEQAYLIKIGQVEATQPTKIKKDGE